MKFLKFCLVGLLSTCILDPAFARDGGANPSKHIAKILAASNGMTEQTAYRVRSVREEYEVLAALKLTPKQQSLVLKKKPFDVTEAADDTGTTRKIWFDISAFYPEF